MADALAMPVHWYYDVGRLRRDFGQITDYCAPKQARASWGGGGTRRDGQRASPARPAAHLAMSTLQLGCESSYCKAGGGETPG